MKSTQTNVLERDCVRSNSRRSLWFRLQSSGCAAAGLIDTAALLLLAFLLPSQAFAQTAAPVATLADLQQQLSNHVSHPRFAAAMWGVKVVSLDSGKTLFEQN